MNKTSFLPCYILEKTCFGGTLPSSATWLSGAGVEIILAFKAYALESLPDYPQVRPSCAPQAPSTSSSWLTRDGSETHTFSPAYTREEFPTILRYSSRT